MRHAQIVTVQLLYYADNSPATYVHLSVTVRGQLAQGTYVHVRENLIVALRIIVTMMPQDTLRQLSGVGCEPSSISTSPSILKGSP